MSSLTAAPDLAQIAHVANQGPFQANWESLKGFQIPRWYQDAKFGIFMHWGIFSVPAYNNEWYSRNMYQKDSDEYKHHIETFGPHTEFGYKDFIPSLTFANYDPDAYAKLFVDSGAKYIIPVAEHHDGFAMYETDLSRWTATKLGPKRDILGDLADACRRHGLHFGLSSHRAEHYWFFEGAREFPCDAQDPALEDFYGPLQVGPVHPREDYAEAPVPDEFAKDWLRRCCELVDKYRPSVIYFDWWIGQHGYRPYLQQFASYYYNRAAEWGQEVAIDYKTGSMPEGTAVFDVERGGLAGIREPYWQTDTSISYSSWCWVTNQNYRTADSIVDDLVDIVSKNGGLLLNIGPKADGTIPDEEQVILREVGAWLKVNGEAIYSSRPWKIYGEGPTAVVEGGFNEGKRPPFTGSDIRFTVGQDGALYATALAWPGETMVVRSFGAASEHNPGGIQDVRLLGHDAPVQWSQTDDALLVAMPPTQPGEHAFTVRIVTG